MARYIFGTSFLTSLTTFLLIQLFFYRNFPDDVGKDLSTSGLGGSPYVPTSNSFMNVNQEFTDKLKNDIGLHSTAVGTSPLNSYSAVAHSSPAGGTLVSLQSSAGNSLLMNTSSSTLNFGKEVYLCIPLTN